jgi:AraC-like DNA-binding protein
MVSRRCVLSVENILKEMGLIYSSVEIGEIDLIQPISDVQIQELKSSLLNSGFELLQDKKSILIEKIVVTIIQMVHYENHFPKTNYSEYISEKLQYDYTYLANTFSEVKGTTIEHFIISHKIERVKELLEYGDLSLTEIAHNLHYRSIAHLSNQFKKITGITPSEYKGNKDLNRKNLEDL